MTDTIKQIEGVLDDIFLTICPTTNMMTGEEKHQGNITLEQYREIKAALSVLQKIASGEMATSHDPSFIRIDAPRRLTDKQYSAMRQIFELYDGKKGISKRDVFEMAYTASIKSGAKVVEHLDQAKHIQMLMEGEMSDV